MVSVASKILLVALAIVAHSANAGAPTTVDSQPDPEQPRPPQQQQQQGGKPTDPPTDPPVVTSTPSQLTPTSTKPGPAPGISTCPTINTCMGRSTAAARLVRQGFGRRYKINAADFLGDGHVDRSIAQCYINQFRTPNNCFNVPNDYDPATHYNRFFQCVQDPNGRYVCWRDERNFSRLRMGNCQLTLPSTVTNFEVTFLGVVNESAGTVERNNNNMPCSTRHCTMSGGVASCPISPLILDTNHDGVVSAKVGIGIDLNGNGIPDGAAVGGDKMLAMSDLNGNHLIDGAEVFGDMTVSPFTKKKLNAPNGFEALRMIAQEASARDKKQYITDGNVDMVALAASLKSHKVTLGFVSGKNNKRVEPLRDVKSISLKYNQPGNDKDDQTQQQKKDGATHKQLGSFVDASGKTHPVDDVWFVEK